MKVFIITEGGVSIGFGHVARCLALYQGFEHKNITPKLIVNGDESVRRLLNQVNYEIIDWLRDRSRIFNIIDGASIVIVDSYLAEADFYQRVSTMVQMPVYLDDNKRLDYPQGIMINGGIHAAELPYSQGDGVIRLLGPEYIPLRKQFWQVPEKEIKDSIAEVMITVGGTDFRNIVPKILKLLVEKYPGIKKNVIIGPAFENTVAIKDVSDSNTRLVESPCASEMRDNMLAADIVISAGGQTLYELARVGVATLSVTVAENQVPETEALQISGFIEYAGKWSDAHLSENILVCFDRLQDIVCRRQKFELGRKIVDGQGVGRIVRYLMEKS